MSAVAITQENVSADNTFENYNHLDWPVDSSSESGGMYSDLDEQCCSTNVETLMVRSFQNSSISNSILELLGFEQSDQIDNNTESPFDLLDQEESCEDRILQSIKTLFEFTAFPARRKLADRLKFLFEEEKAENLDDWEFSLESLSDFISFLATHQDIKYPAVGLSPTGLIQAQWREASNRNVVLEFRGKENVQFVLLAPLTQHTAKLTGITTPDDAWRTIMEYGGDKWCRE